MKNQKISIPSHYFISVLLLIIFNGVQAQVQTPKYVSMTPLSNAYYEYLPQGYSSGGSQKYPLLIFVHGSGETGDGSPAQLPKVLVNGPPKLINQGIFPTSFSVNGQTFKLIVLSPQFTVWPDDIDIDNIINYAIKHYNVDTTRIYLTGLSMGGGVVWQYAGDDINYGNRIAALVPIAGASWPAYFRCANIGAANIAVWATHNNGDPTVPAAYTINYVNTIDTVPTPPNPLAIKTIFQSNSHDAWTQTYSLTFKPNGLNVFEWMLQFKKGSITLAATGLEFNVRKKDDHSIILNWKTYAENNNRGFVIERSSDAINFDSIGFVASPGTLARGAEYTFTDRFISGGKYYYRLRQVDKDNTYQLSAIKFVQLSQQDYIKAYPNPVADMLNINTSFIYNNSQLRVYDVAGRLIKQFSLNGSGTISLPVKILPPGIYSARVADGLNNTGFRFVKN